ncbi:MAG: hypothetical protein O8C64_00560 [Candidatus Methanoperedens sp.]|nr:hypothetical protein [Candidatus Methanoperedens sp.]MCZ7404147.1 hypothetical protein [Candidatus Methanoperedens sp.]
MTLPRKLKASRTGHYGDTEPTIIPLRIKAIWDEADKKNISIKGIVDRVREVRSKISRNKDS